MGITESQLKDDRFDPTDVNNYPRGSLCGGTPQPGGWMFNASMCVLYRALVKRNPDFKINAVPNDPTKMNRCTQPGWPGSTVIKNMDTKKFVMIPFCDTVFGFDPKVWDFENFVHLFATHGLTEDIINYNWESIPSSLPPCSYTPATLTTYYLEGYKEIEKIMAEETYKIRKIPEKLFLRARCMVFLRRYMYEQDDRFDMLGCHDEPDWKGPLPAKDFMHEMGQYSIAMDVNSVSEISLKTVDALGLGCALIRPKLFVQFHNKLIPNYHYAAIDCDDLSDYPRACDAYVEKFEELKKDPDLVKFLSDNGRKWYEENCTIESYVRIFTEELIDLKQLS